ncbi:MAG TPA: zinc metalloprotease HtpX [Candidatus Micrarchaeota archaeon]|nr:zinc metalloprotease HtpX [Candidatus Micrarchaeota archaeon]
MADFYKESDKNRLLSNLLVVVMGAIALGVAVSFAYIFDFGIEGIMVAAIIALIYAYVGYFESDKVVLSVSGAQPAEKRAYPYLYNTVEGLSLAAGLPMPAVYIIDDPSPNAFATGRDPQHSAIAVTTGLLKIMNREELEGVIAHEMSHIKNYDIRFTTIAIVMVGMISIIGYVASRMLFFGGASRDRGRGGELQVILLVLGLVFIIFAPFFAKLVQLAISRKREFLADASGAQLTRYPPGLASALEKLKKIDMPVKHATEVTAPLYFSNPIKPGMFSSIFSTHPPIDERIKVLKSMSFES